MPARFSAPDRLPPVRIASAMSAEAARSTRLWTVPVVSFSPSSNGSRLDTIVDSVRASRAACRSRISRPISGSRSSIRSNFSRTPSSFSARPDRKSAAGDQPSSSAHHQVARKLDRPITIRVSSGSFWPISWNCSTTLGTTKIISANTTKAATQARTIG